MEITCSTGEQVGCRIGYFATEHWRRIRARLIGPATVCSCCHANAPLGIHHRSYERLGNEGEYDVEVLCWRCHKSRHASNPNLRCPLPHHGCTLETFKKAVRKSNARLIARMRMMARIKEGRKT